MPTQRVRNNGAAQQVNNAAPLDLGTIITKMKHYDNSITSVTGDFVWEQHSGMEIEKNEYTLTFEGKQVRMEWEKTGCRESTARRVLGWKNSSGRYIVPDNLLFQS